MSASRKQILGQDPSGNFKPIQVDNSGNVITNGGGGIASSVSITDGSQDVSITDVGGKKALDVNVTDIVIDHANDSVRIGDGTNLIGSTVASGGRGLNVNVVNPSAAADESVIIDKASDTVTYFGYATVGSSEASAVWKIERASVSGAVTKFLFADGDQNYDNIWNNRASLTYS